MKKIIKKNAIKSLSEAKFDKTMQSVARSFSEQAEVMRMILKEIRNIHEDNKYFRQSISGLNSDGISHERRIEDLTIRVEKLELK